MVLEAMAMATSAAAATFLACAAPGLEDCSWNSAINKNEAANTLIAPRPSPLAVAQQYVSLDGQVSIWPPESEKIILGGFTCEVTSHVRLNEPGSAPADPGCF